MSSSIISYLSVNKDEETGDITLDNDCLRHIQTMYANLYSQSNPDLTDDARKEETLKILIRTLKLKDDQLNYDYLNICITEQTEEDIKLEINSIYSGPVEYLHNVTNEPVVPESENQMFDKSKENSDNNTTEKKSKKKKKKKTTSNDENEECKEIDQLTCIIYKNLEGSEIQNFLKTFLFWRVQTNDGQTLE